MSPLEDDIDELALDNLDNTVKGSDEPRRTGASNRRNTGTRIYFDRRIDAASDPSNRVSSDSLHPAMSSSRYPKRRRVSGREKEAVPPAMPPVPLIPQGEKQSRDDSSPDELASNSPHTDLRTSRTNSRPKRAGREKKKKSVAELDKAAAATVVAVVAEADPNQLIPQDAVPEASDDELNETPAAASHDDEDVQGEAVITPIRDEEIKYDRQYTPIPISPVNNQMDDGDVGTPPVEDAIEDNTDERVVDEPVEDAIPENQPPLSTEAIEDHDPEQVVAELSIEESSPVEAPTLRRRSTFKGSFLRVSPPPSPNRYVSKSPPPYSRVSTPIATPRELPPAPPEYVPYKEKMVLKGHKRAVASVKFSPNGRLIASCSGDATIRIWETDTGKHLHTLEGHLAGISTIAWMPDSKVIASGSDDKSIRLWYVDSGKMHPRQLTGHSSYIYSLAFSPKGNMLASGSYDEALMLWDVRTQRLMRSHPAHSDPIGGVDFVHDGTLIVSCSSDGLIRVWDTASGQCLRTLVHEDNAGVTSVCFVPNGKYLLAWTLDSSVRLWNYIEGRCMKTYQGHKNEKFSLAGAHGVYTNKEETERRAFVASGSEDGRIFIWDVQSKAVLQTLEGHEGVVFGVDTWEEGNLMVSCGNDKTIRIWERMKEEKEEEEEEDATAMVDGDVVMKDLNEGDAVVKSADGFVPSVAHPVTNGTGDPPAQEEEYGEPKMETTAPKDEEMVNGIDA